MLIILESHKNVNVNPHLTNVIRLLFVSLAILMTVSCTASNKAQNTLPTLIAEKAISPVQPVKVEVSDALRQDAEMMAADMNISVKEALQRLQNQDYIGELNALIQTNESDTFAGLWIQHEPIYRIVIAFTRDSDKTIAKYISSEHPLANVIEARTYSYTYAQLQTDQQGIIRLLNQIGFPASSGISVQNNCVELYITDETLFEQKLAASNIKLPSNVEVVIVYEPLGENLPFPVNPVPNVFMAQLRVRDYAMMQALLVGTLIIDETDNCLKVQTENEDEAILVVWQPDYFLHNSDGVPQILDATGKVVAHVGETVYMGGGEQWLSDNLQSSLKEPIPDNCMSEKIWRMGDFLPEEYRPDVVGTND